LCCVAPNEGARFEPQQAFFGGIMGPIKTLTFDITVSPNNFSGSIILQSVSNLSS